MIMRRRRGSSDGLAVTNKCLTGLLTLLLNLCLVSSVAIDNDVIGEPDVECLDDEIRFWVKTRKYFAGRIYAKGKSEYPGCLKTDYSSERTNKAHFDLKFGACGMKSLRSVDPRGMYYGVTIVVSFHPLFITKVDQAFHVKCFFEEANRGLTAELGVSMIPTTEVQARHGIPGCTYSIHKSTIRDLDAGRTAGLPVQFARVGDKVLHRWHCDDPMFGVLINNCYVTDGFGQRADVVDSRGCPIDPILITGIRYSADLMTAYAESHVFKFADKPGVWFFCQIQMCMKTAGMCRGVTPPSCASIAPGNGGTTNGGHGGTTNGGTNPYVSGGGASGGFTPFGPAFPSSFDPSGSLGINSNQKQVTAIYEARETADAVFHTMPKKASTGGSDVPYRFEQSDSPGVSQMRSTAPSRRYGQTSFPPPGPFNDGSNGPDNGFGDGGDPFGGFGEQDIEQFERALGGDRNAAPDGFDDFLSQLPSDVSIEDLQRVFLDQADRRFLKNRSPRPTKRHPPTTLATIMPTTLAPRTHSKLTPQLLDKLRLLKQRFDHMKKKKKEEEKTMKQVYSPPPGLKAGDRIDSVEVEWMNDDPTNEIAGQLIIFDLDEDPPQHLQLSSKNYVQAENASVEFDEEYSGSVSRAIGGVGGGLLSHDRTADRTEPQDACPISAAGLTSLMSLMGGVTALLAFITVSLCWRQCRDRSPKPLSAADYDDHRRSSAVPYDRYPSKRPSSTSSNGSSQNRHHRR